MPLWALSIISELEFPSEMQSLYVWSLCYRPLSNVCFILYKMYILKREWLGKRKDSRASSSNVAFRSAEGNPETMPLLKTISGGVRIPEFLQCCRAHVPDASYHYALPRPLCYACSGQTWNLLQFLPGALWVTRAAQSLGNVKGLQSVNRGHEVLAPRESMLSLAHVCEGLGYWSTTVIDNRQSAPLECDCTAP